MSIKKIDHLAIAVASIEEALKYYKDCLGLPLLSIETVEEQGTRVAKLDAGNICIELLEPLNQDTPVGRFLKQRGPGLHHICFSVSDITKEIGELKTKQVQLINDKPTCGAGGALIAFIHPKSAGGVLMELSQKPMSKLDKNH